MTLPKQVTLTTDGGCIGNPGPGGWACVLRFAHYAGEIFGCEPNTTNNRMELKAVIEGLKALRERCSVTVVTDSQYVQRGVTEWLRLWKLNDWQKARGKSGKNAGAVLNKDLWQELDALLQGHKVSWKWVKGHAEDTDNLRCDFLANTAARQQIASNGVLRK